MDTKRLILAILTMNIIGIHSALTGQGIAGKYDLTIDTIINKETGRAETIFKYFYKDEPNRFVMIDSETEHERYSQGKLEYIASKLNPRLLMHHSTLYYVDFKINLDSIGIRAWLNDLLLPTNWQMYLRKGKHHCIWDLYHDHLIYLDALFANYPPDTCKMLYCHKPITFLDYNIICSLFYDENQKIIEVKESTFRNPIPIPNELIQFEGYLVQALNNREIVRYGLKKNLYTQDSLELWDLIATSAADFHFDKRGHGHAFVLLNGELIYLSYVPGRKDPGSNTYWREEFHVGAKFEDGPFTSITLQNRQYLFLQDGRIYQKEKKGFKPLGHLPGSLREISIVWDKENDRAWTITFEQFLRYKQGDLSVLKEMKPLELK